MEYVGSELPEKFQSLRIITLPETAILPGLVNAHCHLEFSDFDQPISAHASFPGWIQSVIEHRRKQSFDFEKLQESRRATIHQGIRESYECGVRWLVDMTTEPWNDAWLADCPIQVIRCIERMDITPARDEQTRALLERVWNHEIDDHGLPRVGLAPHAPYTTSLQLTKGVCDRARSDQRLVSMHVAESEEETEWMTFHRNAAFEGLLSAIIDSDYHQRFVVASRHVQCLAHAWRVLFVHGNYLTTDDLQIISNDSHRLAIVHCPRTFAHFGHRIDGKNLYPLQHRLQLGCRHFLGTDSRASNPDLNLWSELQFLRSNHPDVSAEALLKMATIDAADFLDIGDRYGALQPGYSGQLTAIRLPDPVASAKELPNTLLKSNTRSFPLESLDHDIQGE